MQKENITISAECQEGIKANVVATNMQLKSTNAFTTTYSANLKQDKNSGRTILHQSQLEPIVSGSLPTSYKKTKMSDGSPQQPQNSTIQDTTKGLRVRRWTWTFFQPTNFKESLMHLVDTINENVLTMGVTYIIAGIEQCPTTQKWHLQGYLETERKQTLKGVKSMNYIGDRAHWEPANKSSEINEKYCSKDGDVVIKWGSPMEQGKRTDLDAIRTSIQNGAGLMEIAEQDFQSFLRYQRSFANYITLCQNSTGYVKPKVIVRWGSTGTGKTRHVYDNHAIDDIWTWPGGLWYDGYHHHKIALIDDVAKGQIPPFRFLLRLLDRYAIQVPVKGGFVAWRPDVIYITSNCAPHEWFDNEDIAPLMRRIDQIWRINKLGEEELTYGSVFETQNGQQPSGDDHLDDLPDETHVD